MRKIGFDNAKYVAMQTESILERINKFDNKLYLEFGGKLFDDYHAARVLPGFDVNAKVRLLQTLKDQAEIVMCIKAADIENNKIRADIGITYDLDVLRLIDNLVALDLMINSVVITQYNHQPAAKKFIDKLERRGIRCYKHKRIEGYPAAIEYIVSEEGYGINPYIETTRPLVVVTAPGPGSGKLATCLNQLYHEHRRGVLAGYAKFETFPIWNLPLKHPVNLAYEAATADLDDVNMIDPFHLEAYGTTAVNYNRDIVAFPIVKTIINEITGDTDLYRSPTDMGVNMAGYAITDDEIVSEASRQEMIRRYYKAACDFKRGSVDEQTLDKTRMLLKQLDLTPEQRSVVGPATEKMHATGVPCMAIQLPDGEIITGKDTGLMDSAASCVVNAVKAMAHVADEIKLISPIVLEPILELKKTGLREKNPHLNLNDVLIALSICAATNPTVELAISKVRCLRGLEAHSTHMLTQSDEAALRKLGIVYTSESIYPTDDLYYV